MSSLSPQNLSAIGPGVALTGRSAAGLAWLHAGWVPVLAAAAMSLWGVASIATTDPAMARKQGVFAVLGVLAAAAACLPRVKVIRAAAWPLYWASLAMLVFVLVPGLPEWLVRPKNGARRWISLGVFEFQPSELAKLATVMALALWLRQGEKVRSLAGVLAAFLLAAPPMLLILVEPDLGTAMMIAPAVLAMVVTVGGRKRHVLGLLAGTLLLAPASYPFLKSHQRDRVDALIAQWKGDDRYVRDIGFQADRAMTLAGAGGFAGVGRDHARALVHHNRLPEDHNDMIFAVICCRWGFLGGLLTWGLGLAYAAGCLLVALLAREPFTRLVATGLAGIFAAQLFINTGMTVGIMPITGVTLPFISYGGSSLVAMWISTGLLFNLAMRRPRGSERLGEVS
jgi:cell division protein FtsW (lipid II flippase)